MTVWDPQFGPSRVMFRVIFRNENYVKLKTDTKPRNTLGYIWVQERIDSPRLKNIPKKEDSKTNIYEIKCEVSSCAVFKSKA